MFYNKDVIDIRDNVNRQNIDISLDINEIFISKIIKEVKEQSKILDIGTGNGYVLRKIQSKISMKSISFFGVDNSESMIAEFSKIPGVTAILADNNNLPFNDSSFDIITAKNVTQFSAAELYRVLKPGGHFIFREYGKYKGLVEISKLFETRLIRSRSSDYYVELLKGSGFSTVSVNDFIITRKFNSVDDILKVVKSYPYIKDYSEEDEQILKEYLLESEDHLTIHSDPFILVGGK